MTCQMCDFQWCWTCGDDWKNDTHGHNGGIYSLINCNLFGLAPYLWINKLISWIFFLKLMLLSPLIMTVKITVSICQYTNLKLEYCPCIGQLLGILINLSIALCHILLALLLAVLYSPFSTAKCIYVNTKQFAKIMRHWSSKNRVTGVAKAELFGRIQTSRRRPLVI